MLAAARLCAKASQPSTPVSFKVRPARAIVTPTSFPRFEQFPCDRGTQRSTNPPITADRRCGRSDRSGDSTESPHCRGSNRYGSTYAGSKRPRCLYAVTSVAE